MIIPSLNYIVLRSQNYLFRIRIRPAVNFGSGFETRSSSQVFYSRVADRHRFDADPDPDKTFYFDVDPDPSVRFELDPDPVARKLTKIKK